MRAPGHASSSLRARHPLASSRRGSLYGCRLRRELALRADKRSLPKRFFFTGMLSADLRQTEQGEFTQPLLMNRRQDRHFQRREPGLHDFRLDACRFHDQLVEGGSVERLLYRPGCLRRLACNGLFRGDPFDDLPCSSRTCFRPKPSSSFEAVAPRSLSAPTSCVRP